MKWPYRYWIILMVYLTSYVNFTYVVNIAFSIIAMVQHQPDYIPVCEKRRRDTAEPTILPDYGPRYDWDEKTQALILGADFLGTCLFSLPAGPISEYFGPTKVIFTATLMVSIINALCVPAAHIHYGVLILCRFFIGIGGSLIWPSLQNLIAQWAPPHEKGRFVAGFLGNAISAVVSWPLLGFVTTEYGWDWGFYIISIQMLVFCVVFFIFTTDNPDLQRYISPEEVAFIKESQGDSVSRHKHAKIPYKEMLKSIPLWALVCINFCNFWGLCVQIQSVPKFLAEVIGFNLGHAGIFGAIPSFVRFFASIIFACIGDYLTRRAICPIKVIRKGFVILSHIIPGILMASITLIDCNWEPVVVLLTLSLSINAASVLTNLMNPQDLAPNYAATIFGLMLCISITARVLVPTLTAYFIRENNDFKEWSYTFLTGGFLYIFGGIIFILFGSVKEQSWNQIPL